MKAGKKTGSGWGGRRAGAGRPPIQGRPRPVAHRARPDHRAAHPVYLRLRTRAGLPSLRSAALLEAVQQALGAASSKTFRVSHIAISKDQLRLIAQALDSEALIRGSRGLTIRTARAINRALDRSGPVWADRYYSRALATAQQRREALAEVAERASSARTRPAR
jgi:hypothetical protein